MKKTGLNEDIYDFSVDYSDTTVDVLDIHSYLMKKNYIYNEIFGLVKQIFIPEMMFFGFNLSSVNPLKCISMNNQEWKIRPQIVNVTSEEPVFFTFGIKTSKCSGSCNNINDPYAKSCVPDVVKNLNIKAFNLMSRTNETRRIEWHETCKCKCRLDANVCNN